MVNAEIDYCFGHLITIGNNVTIEDNVIIRAESVSSKNVPNNSVVVDSTVRIIGTYDGIYGEK